MLIWWYSSGWGVFLHTLRDWVANLVDFFSMSSLIRTLFQPYRQISAGMSGAISLDQRFHAFLDRLVSRCVGFVSRLVLLIIGSIFIIVGGLAGLIIALLWPLIPFTPVIGLIITLVGLIKL